MAARGDRKDGAKGKDPYPAALRLLGRRDHSHTELRNKLLQRGFDTEKVEAVLTRCLELGYLDDQRYAEQLARSLSGSGRAVGRRLELELKKRGIEATMAEKVRSAIDATTDREALINELTARRYPGFIFARADDRQKRRVVNYFLRRGFALREILTALKREDNC